MRRADPPPAAASSRPTPRFEIDRSWLWRGALVLVIVGFLVVLTKASSILYGSGNKRLERYEREAERPAATRPASPPPAASR